MRTAQCFAEAPRKLGAGAFAPRFPFSRGRFAACTPALPNHRQLIMRKRKPQILSRKALKARYLECLNSRSPATLRQTVQGLLRLGIRRDLLLGWAATAGHDRKYVGKLLCECLTALGVRQQKPGAGRRPTAPALLLLAFAHELFGTEDRKRLRAAWRAAGGPTAAHGLKIIPEPELYSTAVAQFSKRLTEIAKTRETYEESAA
jgi:hypothetical protein